MSESFSKIEQDAWGGFLGTYARINRLIEADLQEHSRIKIGRASCRERV